MAVVHAQHLYRQCRRLRSLAKARQLPQVTAFILLKCSQLWELACLRKRWLRHNISIAIAAAFAASLKLDSSHI